MPAKVSFNNSRQGYAAHNDRSMYEPGAYDLSANLHWDWQLPNDEFQAARGAGESVSAERDYYDTRYSDILAARNESKLKRYHADEVWSMAQWAAKNPPHETVLQLGAMGDDTEEALKARYAIEAARRFREEVRKVGGEVISIDVHMDEASPHAHVRWAMNDMKGKPNVKGCLRTHGYDVAEASRTKNPMKLWTADVRDRMEELAEKMGAELDKHRISRRNLSVRDFKATKRVEEALQIEEEAQRTIRETKRREQEKLQAIARKKREITTALDQEIKQRENRIKDLAEQEKTLIERISALTEEASRKLDEVVRIMRDREMTLREKLEAVRNRRKAVSGMRDSLRPHQANRVAATHQQYISRSTPGKSASQQRSI